MTRFEAFALTLTFSEIVFLAWMAFHTGLIEL